MSSLIKTFLFSLITLSFTYTQAATFDITNNCPGTVWAAAVPGGGKQLNQGEIWSLNIPAGTNSGRIWARTGCSFDGSGNGRCQTGDCGGKLGCQTYGTPPNTLAEFSLNQSMNVDFFDISVTAVIDGFSVPMEFKCHNGTPPNTPNQYENLDIIDISVVDGFNVPMLFSPTSNGCTRGIKCTGDIIGQCPYVLKTQGGCNDACTVFKTDNYCCNSGNCGPTKYSQYFKNNCPDAYSYPKDDATSAFSCKGGTNYKVVFCP